MAENASKELKFEEAMVRLEELVHNLEKGDQPLDKALSSFEEGVKLVKQCQKQLSDAQVRVEKIIQDDDGDVTTEPHTSA